jgi:hypothetical protein
LHAYCGIDLLGFFRGECSWRKLEVLLERLPWDSAYKLAITDDEESAAQYLDMINDTDLSDDEDARQVNRVPLDQWNQFAELRASILDGLMLVARTIVMVNTPKGRTVPPIKSQPRPETAIDRVRRKKRDTVMADLENQLNQLNARWSESRP